MNDLDPTIGAALAPAAFFVAPPGRVRVEKSGHEGMWRVFLDRPGVSSDRPLIEIARRHDHIEVQRNLRMRDSFWLSESVGTIPLDRVRDRDTLARLLRRCIGFALTGTSRLAIASVETPHPVFSLGMLAYLPAEDRSLLARARALEARLRAGLPIETIDPEIPVVLRVLFDHLALSPYTGLVENLVAFVRTLERGVAIDALGYMLRHLARHLNAFDLLRFHNLGANYPDALMLDAVLRAFIELIDDLEASPMRRRALRQGWLARKRCEGLRVPDMPTSPGDNARQLPGGAPAVPDLQITEPAARTKRLFPDAPAEGLLTPAARVVLHRAVADLQTPDELRELGIATFLDRPLGAAKRAGQADRTPLLSYEAFSPRLALTRLRELHDADFLTAAQHDSLAASARALRPPGWPVSKLPGHAREGVVSLEDAKKVALDFIFTRTTRSSLDALLGQYDWTQLAADPQVYAWLLSAKDLLLIRTGRSSLTAFDGAGVAKCHLHMPDPPRFLECGGVEYVHGLRAALSNGTEIALPPRLTE